MALFKIMKTRWIEIIIIVMALGLLSLCFADWNVNKPADDDAIYTWDNSIRANNAALEAVFGVGLAMTTFEPDTIIAKSPWVDVTHSDYGALGDGTTDDSAAFQLAIDACPTGGVVFVPPTTTSYRVANLIIKKPMTLVGVGWGSKLRAVAGETGYLIKVDGTEAGAVTRTSQGIDGGSNTLCIRIRNLYLEGNARGASIGGLYLYNADWGLYKDLWIFNFAREAINCYGGLRESTFDNINTRWCGNGTTYPNIRIKEMDETYGTVINNMYFSKLWSIWPLGDHVQIDTANGKIQNVRSIVFEQCMFHGIGIVNDGAGNNPFDITFTGAQKAFKIFDILSGDDISISNSFFITAGLEVPCINIETGAKDVPARIRITGNRFTGRYDSSATANDIGIHLQNGSLVFSGNVIAGTAGSSITIKTEAGTSLYLGANFIAGGDPSFAGGVYYGDIASALMNWQDTNFMNLDGITIGGSYSAGGHYSDVSLGDTGVLDMKETTTPTATPNYGKLYWKDDNKLYGQDGAGNEYEIDLTAD